MEHAINREILHVASLVQDDKMRIKEQPSTLNSEFLILNFLRVQRQLGVFKQSAEIGYHKPAMYVQWWDRRAYHLGQSRGQVKRLCDGVGYTAHNGLGLDVSHLADNAVDFAKAGALVCAVQNDGVHKTVATL